MNENGKVLERGKLLTRAYSKMDLFRIGREYRVPYFQGFASGWDVDDEDEAAFEIASRIDDEELKRVFREFAPRGWAVFRGRYYVLEDGKLLLEGFGENAQTGIQRAKLRFGSHGTAVLTALVKNGGLANAEQLKRVVKSADLDKILDELEKSKIITNSYMGDKYQEWEILEETLPIVEVELGMKRKPPRIHPVGVAKVVLDEEAGPVDYATEEKRKVERMDNELNEYLEDLLKHRLERTIRFGKQFNIGHLAGYLQELFGSVLYFDSLLSITQQYGLADIEVLHEHGKTGKRTGWSLALFGDPGTGKSFSTRDMILGKPDAKIGAHGIPGRNRYCGGITPARFMRIGEAYSGKVFNFVVPEFNDFFRYRGMVEPLKLAMEQGEIKYETHSEIVGPYKFSSFFSVNYNVSVHDRGYAITIQDPNFNAIEDRMLCRLHRLTKERFIEITKSQMNLALGAIDIERGAREIRDHLALIYAIETLHPLVRDRFPYKPVIITPSVFSVVEKAREAILGEIHQEVVKFSARLEDKALRFAFAASLMDYFSSDTDCIPVSEEALKYAVQLYVEEASVRSKEIFKPEEVLNKIFQD